MFTTDWREQARAEIIDFAKNDSRIKGGAVTGSASVGKLDAWSDIDLAFGVGNAAEVPEVLATYTDLMYQNYGAIHHLDVPSGPWIYRVFLLSNTLQVDIAFVPQEHFGARAATFKLIFGENGGGPPFNPVDCGVYVGWCWLYALHIRSSLKRRKIWQAEYFISAFRNAIISLICRRFKLPEKDGRGVDALPREELLKLEPTLTKSLDFLELQRAFVALTKLYLSEIGKVDNNLRQSIEPVVVELSTN